MNEAAGEGPVDYRDAALTRLRKLRIFAEGILLCMGLNYLFYESWAAFIPMLPIPYLYYRWKESQAAAQRRQRLSRQFKDALTSLSVSVQAGYSLENAILGARKDLERIYSPEEEICREFRYFASQLRISVPAEELFGDLGRRSGAEDIRNFASVLWAAKRTGGDTGKILQRCAQMVGDKIDVQQEIEASVAAKQMEQMVMSFMPAAIIVYLKVTSPGFLGVLYGNTAGVCIMTGCLAVYFGAWVLGKKITEAGYGFTRADFSAGWKRGSSGTDQTSPGKGKKGLPALSDRCGSRKSAGSVSDPAGENRTGNT